MENKNYLNSEEAEVMSRMVELQKDLEAIKRLREKYGKSDDTIMRDHANNTNGSDTGANVRTFASYPSDGTWEDRVLFVLKELGSAFANEVANKLKEYQPEITEDRASTVSTNKLSILYRNEIIGAEVYGRKYKYFFK